MEIHPGYEIHDLGIYIPQRKLFVIGDLHIGIEEALNKQGVLVPRWQHRDMMERLEKIFKNVSPEIIVINGDIKHEFGTISNQEWREVLKIMDFLVKHCKKLILVKGNHDTILGPVASRRDLTIVDEYREDGLLIIHGHKEPQALEDVIIIGHEHPVVALSSETRTEKYRCFLKGKYKRKVLLIEPSFNLVTHGTDVLEGRHLSPLIDDVRNFDVFVVEDKTYFFGKVKNLM